MFSRYILFIALTICSLDANAQAIADELFFEHLTTGDGLSHNYIRSIFQDEDGFIWLGTDDGLNRYDGQNIDMVLSTATQPALGGNNIRRIVQDADKRLWILHENGIDKIDYYTQHIKHFLYSDKGEKAFVGIGVDNHRQVIVYTEKKIMQYDKAGDSLFVVQQAPEEYRFSAFTQCRGKYYFATRKHGMIVYDGQWKLAEYVYPHSIQSGPLSNGLITKMVTDSEGCIWSVGIGFFIERYDPQNRKTETYKLTPSAVINREVRDIIELDEQYMLVGTFNGIYRLRKDNLQEVIAEKKVMGKEGNLSHYSIYSLYKDRQGILWVGTYAGGVNYSHAYNHRFCFFSLPDFSGRIKMAKEDDEGNIWLATEGCGLLRHNPKNGQIDAFLLNANGHFDDNVIKSLCISGDSIMCGNQRGELSMYSIKKNKFFLVHKYTNSNILDIYKDSKQNWWVSIQDYGVVNLSDASAKFPCSNMIGEIEPGILLFATQDLGLYIYNLNDQSRRVVSARELGLSRDKRFNITSFYRDGEHNLWMTTERHGVIVLDEHWNLKHRYLPVVNGNPYPEKMYFVTEWKKGYLWMIGAHTLFLFDSAKEQFHTFDQKNGLRLTDIDAVGLIDSKKRFWIPGNTGYVMVDNRNFPLNNTPASVILTNLRINNNLQRPLEKGSVLDKRLSETEVLLLKYNQTNLSITYASDNHIYGKNDSFYYKMDGVDPDWIDAGNRQEVFYSNLAPGNYVLRIKVLNNDGAMGSETELKIKVLPPLWARWWAFVIYVLILLVILQRYIAYRQRKQKLEHELCLKQIEKNKSEELNRELQTFFTQVAHEFRTPLTLILNPLEEIQNKIIHISGVKEELQLVRRNAMRLLTLVNDLMDLRKIENGNGNLTLSSFSFNDFIQEIYYSFQATARQRGLILQLSLPEEQILATFDKGGLEKVFFNLLSNALKFTPEGGTISLTVSIFEGKNSLIHAEVKDTGIGISDEDILKIFKPFALSHQDLHGQIGGSGVGLTIARTIVEQHGGTISVARIEPHGTCFTIELPWKYDKRYEVTQLAPIESIDETSDPISTFKVTSISDSVLLVDDNPEILGYLQKELSKRFKIFTAQNGREALEVLSKEDVSLIVSDVMMPEMDGIELCTHIKENPSLCHLPVVLLTAKAMTVYVEEGFLAGADDYLIKPFKVSTLVVRINNILGSRKKLKEIYGKRVSLKSAGLDLESADTSFVDRYETIVKDHLSDPDLDVEMLCKEMGMSRATLYRRVKNITTLSPAEVIRNIRLECAAEMLRTTGQTATEIAYLTGFGSYNHFGDYFKSIYGVSPKAYKEKCKNPD